MPLVDVETGLPIVPSREVVWIRIAELAVRLNDRLLAERETRKKKARPAA